MEINASEEHRMMSHDLCHDSDDVEIDVDGDVEIDVVTSCPSSRASSPTNDDVTNDYDVRSSPGCSPSLSSSCGEECPSNDDKDSEDDVIKNNDDNTKTSILHTPYSDVKERCKVTSMNQDIPMITSGLSAWPKYPRDQNGGHPGWGQASHPFLALSFQRLQEIHMRALQDRLKFNMGVYGMNGAPQPPMYNPNAPPNHSPHSTPYCTIPNMQSALPEALYPTNPHVNPVIQPEVLRPLPNLKWEMNNHRTWTQDLNTPLNLVTKLSPDSVSGSTGSSPGSSAGSPSKVPWLPGVPQGSPVQMPWSPENLKLDLSSETPRRRTNEPPRYVCEACNKSYATFSGLSKHKQFHCTSHIKKQFNCKFCDKTYVSLGALKMHIRTHTLPCKCPLCGKAFSRPWLLQGHIRTHTGEKPFRCSHCARAFADRSNLRAHLQTHTDIKKYNCKNCSKTFSRMSLLVKHQEGGCSGILR